MIQFNKQNIEAWGKKESFRTMCTKAVTMIAGENSKVLYMQADLGRAMNGKEFYELYPDRYIQI
jgi:transketolase C-terminal domain/subunit